MVVWLVDLAAAITASPLAATATCVAVVMSWSHESWLHRSAMRSVRVQEPTLFTPLEGKDPRISVVICIRNGASHWDALWKSLKEQQGIVWELVLVDDASTDGLQSRWLEAKKEEVGFSVQWLEMVASRPGKKDALQWGVSHAKTPLIAVTDVDCIPSHAFWLFKLHAEFLSGADGVLGVSLPLRSAGSGLLGACQQLDALRIARSYVGWAQSGSPYMGVGRNMAYRKELFQGFSEHEDVPSGDDDLLVQSWLQRDEIQVVPLIHRSAQTDTHAPVTWAAWSRQKQRHWTTAWRYSAKHQWGLMFPRIAAVLVWTSMGAWIWSGFQEGVLHNVLWIVGGLLLGGWGWRMLNFRSFAQACGTPSSWYWLGWAQPFLDTWLGWQVGRSRGFRNSDSWD